MTPGAGTGKALQKDGGADAGAVVDAEALDVEHRSGQSFRPPLQPMGGAQEESLPAWSGDRRDEIIAVAADAHHQVADKASGCFTGLEQRFPVRHVDLEFEAAPGQIGFGQAPSAPAQDPGPGTSGFENFMFTATPPMKAAGAAIWCRRGWTRWGRFMLPALGRDRSRRPGGSPPSGRPAVAPVSTSEDARA